MRKIVFITGSRADACPLSSVVDALGKHAIRIKTQGLHGHETALLSTLRYHGPDLVVLLGDRYEALIAASVASFLRIPIVHVHGGDYTPNCVDEQYRNAIAKLAYWHFPACDLHAKRLIAMGEIPENIFVCGAPGVDNLVKPVLSCAECEDDLGVKLKSPVALVCYHPETLGDSSMEWCGQLDDYATVIISGANADPGGDAINEFCKKNAGNAVYRKTFSAKLWLSLMHYADVLIGNSSGFVFEGLTLGKKFINIGNRQQGRYEDALELFKKDWQQLYPFGKPGTVGKAIAEKLMSLEMPGRPRKYASA